MASIGGIFSHRAFPKYCGTKAGVIRFGLIDAISEKCLTPVSTILEAHDKFIDDGTGMIEYGNGYKTERAVTVWEPHFRAMHGDDSTLDDAVA
ncbi:hypothetical protein AC579_3384 [Pseudocercospora musae]|uniref:Uncharacterized protein n=1 Tax=Pseudocercospora musae TaxID=113226 RepID=A0A139ILF6_9PEZI|nr:hypothetical protein AC579_3384 [Pseudocercospora musae]